MKSHLALLLLTALIASPSVAGSLARSTAKLPELDAPPQGEAQWVARSMRLNGLPMTLKAFQSRLSSDAVLHHYESWSRGVPRAQTRRSNNPPWQVLAIQSQCCYITIQARATLNGSEGTLAVSAALDRAELKTQTAFPRPSSASIVNLQQYEDAGVESEHISLSSTRSVTTEASAFSQALTRAGWRIIRNHRSSHTPRGHVLEAQKGAQHALLTILPDQVRPTGTAIVVVWRKA